MNNSHTCERESIANERLQSLLNEHDIARITGLSVASIRRYRLIGQGPKFLKLNSAVRYRAEDLKAWLESRPTGGGNQADAQ
jgi:predicted DNA-binding transcriptional regulator AlpA